jgi:hypothetical protein
MPASKILPDKNTLRHWIEDEGLTHQECADRVYSQTGQRVGRSAISVACHRYGLSANGMRYRDYTPWKVSAYHMRIYPLRMLRLLGRRNTKGADSLSAAETQSLDAWLRTLAEKDAIVGYDPDTDEGCFLISSQYKDHDGPAPIRIKTLHMNRTPVS